MYVYIREMGVIRINQGFDLGKLRSKSGYILNVISSKARIHRTKCGTVLWMNLSKRGGVYYTDTLEEARAYIESEKLGGEACRICLPTLSYKPRPENLIERLKRIKT